MKNLQVDSDRVVWRTRALGESVPWKGSGVHQGARIAATAETLGYSVTRMPFGAGHDAQMFAPNCPTAMNIVPSNDGIRHNVRKYTAPAEFRAGADVFLQVMRSVAES